MATKAKKNKTEKVHPDKLKDDNMEAVDVNEFIRDERTHKILGVIFILIGLLLFIAFTSYLFTWEEDQDKVFKEGGQLLLNSDTPVANLMGTFGAYISHLLINKGFGVASYLICTFFFIIGVNLIIGRKVFSVIRNLKYVILGLPILSVTASILAEGHPFPWGGSTGDFMARYLKNTIGETGTYAIIGVAFLSYFIWRFNPSFKRKPRVRTESIDNEEEVSMPQPVAPMPATESATSTSNTSSFGNTVHGESTMKNVGENAPAFNHQLELIEKDIEENTNKVFEQLETNKVTDAPPATEANTGGVVYIRGEEAIKEHERKTQKRVAPPSDLTLEVKQRESEEEIAEAKKTAKAVLDSAPYDPILDLPGYKYPTLDLLEAHGTDKIVQDPSELENNKNQIINTLKNYDISIQRISATVGPTVTLYEIVPAAGVRISRIKNLEDDIALSLAALGIRIIAPIPGKGTIGIEVPNSRKTMVSMRTLLGSEKFKQNKFSLPIAIGKKIDNENFIVDLASMPHLLMAGATGQGKSVGVNAILVSLLYSKHPSQLKFVLIDPKKVELSIYKTIEHHFLAKLPGEEDAIITDTKKVIHTLNALCIEMDNRYDLLKEAHCRNLKEYNEKFVQRKLNPEKGHQFLPFIVLVIDEFADLIMTAGKEIEMPIARLAQLARAVGIHLIIATQRPSVNIITGTIKANFPARVAFKVSSKIDSRTILDIGGAEQLIGKGDMLVSYNGDLVRLQCAFVDTPEVDNVCNFISSQRGYPEAFLLPEYVDEKEFEKGGFDVNDKDNLFEDAARLIVSTQSGSTSLLQRKMKLGYNRAGRLMDQLEAAGIVGASQGSKTRDVLIKTDADLQDHLNNIL